MHVGWYITSPGFVDLNFAEKNGTIHAQAGAGLVNLHFWVVLEGKCR